MLCQNKFLNRNCVYFQGLFFAIFTFSSNFLHAKDRTQYTHEVSVSDGFSDSALSAFSVQENSQSGLLHSLGEGNPYEKIFLNPSYSNILFGVSLEDAKGALYSNKEDQLFLPASTSKLFTAAFALNELGPQFRYETKLDFQFNSINGTARKLQLFASGDPTWGMEEHGETLVSRIDFFIEEMKKKGVRQVEGVLEVFAPDLRWSETYFPEGWGAGDTYECYGALAQSFNLDLNCATLIVSSAKSARWSHSNLTTPIILEVQKGPYTALKVQRVQAGNGNKLGYKVTGTFAAQSSPQSFVLPVLDVAAWVHSLFQSRLKFYGISILPDAEGTSNSLYPTQEMPENFAALSIVFHSVPLQEIIKPFLKFSLNLTGDALLKTIAARSNAFLDIPLIMAGENLIQEFAQKISKNHFVFKIKDGSGLSRKSEASPQGMFSFLRELANQYYFHSLWNALPVAGVDGTLVNRMRNTAAQGVLRGKTGTLSGVYNLSGYVPVMDINTGVEKYFPFVVFTQTTVAYRTHARLAQDHLGALLSSNKISH